MAHKKTWACINPCGDGCDGNHLPEPPAPDPRNTDSQRLGNALKDAEAARQAHEQALRRIEELEKRCGYLNETRIAVMNERDQAQRDNARLREALEYLRDHELTPKQVEDRAREALSAHPAKEKP